MASLLAHRSIQLGPIKCVVRSVPFLTGDLHAGLLIEIWRTRFKRCCVKGALSTIRRWPYCTLPKRRPVEAGK
jgi:hypothetical protein